MNINTSTKKLSNSRLINFLYSYIFRYKLLFFLIIFILLLNKIIVSTIPLLIRSIIYLLSNKPAVIDLVLFKIYFTNILQISLVILFLLIGYFYTYFLTNSLSGKLSFKVIQSIRKDLLYKLLNNNMNYFNINTSGKLITNLINDVNSLQQLISCGSSVILGNILLFGIIIFVSINIDLYFTIYFIFIFTIIFYIISKLLLYMRKYLVEARKILSYINIYTQSFIQGIGLIHLYNKYTKFYNSFTSTLKDYCNFYIKINIIYSLYFPLLDSIVILPQVLLILFTMLYTSFGFTIDIAGILVFILYVPIIVVPIKDIVEHISLIQLSIISLGRIINIIDNNIFNESDNLIEQYQGKDNKIIGKIEFRNVTFSYKDNIVLDDISFIIYPKEYVTILGITGSGKTTIINLINGLYKPQKGVILIDDLDINEYNVNHLRASIGYVLQDFYLYSDTIENNITLYKNNVDFNLVVQKMKELGVYDIINRLPNGINTILLERGVGLSYGQLQIISLIRGLIEKKPILILDEAISNIDKHTFNIIFKALNKMSHHYTSINISHRLETLNKSSRIILIEKGKLIANGTHNELLKSSKIYKNFIGI